MSADAVTEVITYTFTYTEIISITVSVLLGIVSIVLGVFAIWLTLHLKKESDSVNEKTRNLLMDIRTDSKSISNGIMTEMRAWGDAGRKSMQQNQVQASDPTGFSSSSSIDSEATSVNVKSDHIKPIKLDENYE